MTWAETPNLENREIANTRMQRYMAPIRFVVKGYSHQSAILNVNRYSVWAALGGAGAVPVRRIDSGEHQGIRTAP